MKNYQVLLQQENQQQRKLELKSNDVVEVLREIAPLCTAGEKCVIISTEREIFGTDNETNIPSNITTGYN